MGSAGSAHLHHAVGCAQQLPTGTTVGGVAGAASDSTVVYNLNQGDMCLYFWNGRRGGHQNCARTAWRDGIAIHGVRCSQR